MYFDLSEDQQELRSTVRAFLEGTASLALLMRRLDSADGYDEVVWNRIATELELTGLAVPEEYGGSGFSLLETCIVLGEMGRVLYDGPFFASSVLATTALLASDDEDAKREYLPQLARGTLLGTVVGAGAERTGAESVAVKASRTTAGGWVLDGRASHVIDGDRAGVLIVPAAGDDGLDCFVVDGDADGLSKASLPAMDLTRPLAEMVFAEVPARRLGGAGCGEVVAGRVAEIGSVCLAAEQMGAAEVCVEMAVEYAKQRHQFGRPIGSFQAIKHRCASVHVAVEAAKSSALYAGWAASGGVGDIAVIAGTTKACCSEAFYLAATSAIQVHGGIGFTWEHPAHLLLRRAVSSREFFGSPAFHRQRVGAWIAEVSAAGPGRADRRLEASAWSP